MMPSPMFELYDRRSANLIDRYPSMEAALTGVREEWSLNADADFTLGRVDNDHTVEVWAGARLRGLLSGIRLVGQPRSTGTVTQVRNLLPVAIRTAALAAVITVAGTTGGIAQASPRGASNSPLLRSQRQDQ
jgi:hypothetical protein